ncbi:MAG: translation initiation factor IF-2 [Gammaproteobacteria bacterium]
MTITVKDFSRALKIDPAVLLERMKAAGLRHTKDSDEVTPKDKQTLLLFLKEKKSASFSTSDSGVTIKSKGIVTPKKEIEQRSFTDNIEAKRKAAAEQLKEQQQKREDQIKEAIKQRQEQTKEVRTKPNPNAKPPYTPRQRPSIDIGTQLSNAAKEYSRREKGFDLDSAHQFSKPKEFIKRDIEIPETILVGELAKLMSLKGGELVKSLMSLGVMATINDSIDQETAILVTEEIGHNPVPITSETVEEQIIGNISYSDEPVARHPVVTVMGHVDHGKTSLLDFIRKSKVAAGEAGGITQHIGAYQVKVKDSLITFIDTPGHAAFSAMRARGANTTDIVILVVAANDSVMPQTEEAIHHAKAAGVSIVVAVNKIDLADADIDKVKSDLASKDLVPEDWGGNTQVIPVSAHTGEGIDNLLDALILESEMLELKAHVKGPAQGVCIESELDKFRGPVATLLIQNGTLSLGNIVVCGTAFGRVKNLSNAEALKLKTAGPSDAIEVLGLNIVPNAGDLFQVVQTEKEAKEIIEYREIKLKNKKVLKHKDEAMGNLFDSMGGSQKKSLHIVLKSDVAGTSEAISFALQEIGNSEAYIKVVSAGVGGISESDVNLALATESIIFGFNVRADNAAKKLVEENEIVLNYHSIIYELIDDAKLRLSGLLDPIIKEVIIGNAAVLEVFNSPKFGQVAGCQVVEGSVLRNKPVRVLRDNIVIHQGELDSLRRFKDDVNEVKTGTECGIGIKNYKDIKAGDVIEVFDRREEKQTI